MENEYKLQVDSLIYNYKYLDTQVQNLRSEISGLFENDSGTTSKQEDPVEYKELTEKLENLKFMRQSVKKSIIEKIMVNSFAFAEEYAKFLNKQMAETKFFARVKDVGDIDYLCVTESNDELVTKVDIIIDAGQNLNHKKTRNLTDDEIEVLGKKIQIKQMLPKEYREYLNK